MRSASAPSSARRSGRARACRASRRWRSRTGPAPIINHPDVKRMLLMMKSQTEASRALTLYTALQLDLAEHSGDDERTRRARRRARELLTPIVKGWCTEIGNEVAAHRRAGARRHGLHRGDRRRAVRARRAHHDDLRGHDRHPVERSHRPQARPRPRRGDAGAARGHGARAAGDSPARTRRSRPRARAALEAVAPARRGHAGAAQVAGDAPRCRHGGRRCRT